MADADYALALSLQDEFSALDNEKARNSGDKRKRPTSIVDDCWETIDPTPDIRELFLQFNDKYFDGKLSCCEVKWAPRMTLCAGVCCYEGRGGLCSVKLSMPLLKLRPRKDLVQTLLHEMIHAYLFVTHNNKDHDSHGAEFQKHMLRINKSSGANITVYHNFHDEVDLYRQHWWRCDGPCQKRPPYYGMIKRAMNREPAPRDPWWPDHERTCGGTYHKVREPEDYGKKKRKKEDDTSGEATKSTPKIYDLWNKESGTKSGKTNSSDSSTNGKTNDSQTSTNRNDINSGDLSTNGGTKINNFWKVESDDSSGKENDVQKINHALTPFTGKGRVLGSVQSETSTNSVKKQGNTRTVSMGRDFSRGSSVEGNGQDFQGIESSLQNNPRLSSRSGHLNGNVTSTQSKRKAIDINENDFVNDADIDIGEKTVRSHFIKGNESSLGTKLATESISTTLNENEEFSKDTQRKVNLGTQLTIVDAFKNVGEKKVPLVVIDETPTKPAVRKSVQCPVCLLKVEESQINAHLDTCLS